MSTSLHRQVATQLGREWLSTDEGREKLAFADAMRDDPEWRSVIDAFGQPFHGWDVGQLSSLYGLLSLISHRRLSITRFDVGAVPGKDSKRAENQASLDRLPDVVRAWVHPDQRSEDSDGQLEWSTDLRASILTKQGSLRTALLPPGAASLEIGHTDASRSYLHLGSEGVLARWPYRSREVVLFALHPRNYIISMIPVPEKLPAQAQAQTVDQMRRPRRLDDPNNSL